MGVLKTKQKPVLFHGKRLSSESFFIRTGKPALGLNNSRAKRLGTRLPHGLSREKKLSALKDLAMQSTHFIKPLSARNNKIRGILAKYGIRTEKIIEDLKNGTALFEREGFELASPEGRGLFAKRPRFFLKKLEGIAAKLIVLEVAHGHLHAGNFAITANGELILLDLGRATISNYGALGGRMTKARFAKVKRELNYFCDKIALYYCRTVHKRNPSMEELVSAKKKIWDETSNLGSIFAKKLERGFRQNNR